MEKSAAKTWLIAIVAVAVGLLVAFPATAMADDVVSSGEKQGDSSINNTAIWESFPDIASEVEKVGGPENVWYITEGWLDYVATNGLITGYADSGNFGPDDNITRGQVATILYRAATGDTNPNNDIVSTFPDVETGVYYTAAIEWAYRNGVVTGYTGGSNVGKFCPDEDVTREQLATMIARFADTRGEDSQSITPAVYAGVKGWSDVSDYALMPMAWCYYYGVLTGIAGIDLAPQDTATRAQMAKMITVVVRGSLAPAIPPSGEWMEDSKGWRYLQSDGTYVKSRWKEIDGSWYCFDSAGYRKTGWYQNSDGQYYLKPSGELALDEWIDCRYYFGEDGLRTVVEPELRFTTLSQTDPSVSSVAFLMDNIGEGTIRIIDDGAWMLDADSDIYNRDLLLVDSDGNLLEWIEFPPNSSDAVGFFVDGPKTWYDAKTRIFFQFEYCGESWQGWVSHRYGFGCSLL